MAKPKLILIQGMKDQIKEENYQRELKVLWNRIIKDFLDRRDVRIALGDKAPPERLRSAVLRVPEIKLCCFK